MEKRTFCTLLFCLLFTWACYGTYQQLMNYKKQNILLRQIDISLTVVADVSECLRKSVSKQQICTLTSEWTLWTWECRLPLWEKEAGQNMQRWGFSPVCLAMWVCSTTFWLKALAQCVHLKGRSPERRQDQTQVRLAPPETFLEIRKYLLYNKS